jgi:hypothetical protein
MEFWKNTPYIKWYKSHIKFSILANLFIEDIEHNNKIYQPAFESFIKSIYCHSKSEEKMFSHIDALKNVFEKHHETMPTSNEEIYVFCKSLIAHMQEEELIVKNYILSG